MKVGAIVCLILFICSALLSLLQLWFAPLDSELFFKILITLGVLFVITLGVSLVRREYIDNKEMEKNHYID